MSRFRSTLLLLPFALAACGHRDRDEARDEARDEIRTAARDGAGVTLSSDNGTRVAFDGDSASRLVLGPGDVKVTSIDGNLVMAVVGDTVRIQLSDSLRRSVAHDVDTSVAGAGGGLGGVIARSVSGIVASAMGFSVRIPVAEIENARYEDGQIRFETRDTHRSWHDRDRDRGGSHRASDRDARFSAEDGERFVAAVKRRQRGGESF